MQLFAKYFVLLMLLLTAMPGFTADLVFREQATQHGTVIRLGDIADISAATAAEVKSLASIPLMPSPAQGTQQFLNRSQVRDLLTAQGVQLHQITLKGAQTVAIGGEITPAESKQSVTPVAQTLQETRQRVHDTILQHVQDVSQHSRWSVEVVANEKNLLEAASLGKNPQIRSARAPRSGKERFYFSEGPEREEITVWANVTKIQSVVVVKQRIERGQLVRTSDVEVRDRQGNLPSNALTALDQVIGKEAQRTIRPDEILLQNHVRAPWQVRRGETVNVFVRTGGISVRTRAIAKQNGAMGELITLETIEDRQRLEASVTGLREVAIYATGGRAGDYASLSRDGTQRR